jgi:hypothetical protein
MATRIFCDKCDKEIADTKEAVTIGYLDKEIFAQNGQFLNNYVGKEKILCQECRKLVMDLFVK